MKLSKSSNFFYPNPVSDDVDRTLQSPEYGDEYSFLLQTAGKIVLSYLESPLSSKDWRFKYRTGCRRPVRELADNLDLFVRWLGEFVSSCPDAADRLFCAELLQRLREPKDL